MSLIFSLAKMNERRKAQKANTTTSLDKCISNRTMATTTTKRAVDKNLILVLYTKSTQPLWAKVEPKEELSEVSKQHL